MSKNNEIDPRNIITPNLVRWLVGISVLLAFLFVIAQQSMQIKNLETQNQARANEYTAQTLLQAVNDLNQPLPTEPSTGKVYLLAQHLSLPPAPASLGQLVYSTAYKDDNSQFPVHIAAKNDITQASQSINSTQQDSQKIFQALPAVQACARGVGMTYTKADQPAAAEKTLTNGKILYLYTESLCQNAALLNYVKQIDSY